jgi:hypothetical protein
MVEQPCRGESPMSNGGGWSLKVFGDAMFIHLNVTTRSAFSTEEDNKIGIDNVPLSFLIKNK